MRETRFRTVVGTNSPPPSPPLSFLQIFYLFYLFVSLMHIFKIEFLKKKDIMLQFHELKLREKVGEGSFAKVK
jgi:hypothetical protein